MQFSVLCFEIEYQMFVCLSVYQTYKHFTFDFHRNQKQLSKEMRILSFHNAHHESRLVTQMCVVVK